MISREVVRRVQQLLAEGVLSYREIACLTGVSRTTVGQISTGKHTSVHGRANEEDVLEPTEPPRRCSGCGGLVYQPCVLCQVRRLMAHHRLPGHANRHDRKEVGQTILVATKRPHLLRGQEHTSLTSARSSSEAPEEY